MRPLKTNESVLMWLNMCPPDKFISKPKNVAMTSFAVIVFLANVCATATAIAFFRKSISVDVEGSLYSLVQIAGSFGITFTMIVVFSRRKQISVIFNRLEDIQRCSKRTSRIVFIDFESIQS